MHHAWLLGGPKGIGKATLAYRFARFVLAHPDPATAAVREAQDLSVAEDAPAFRKVANRSHPNLLVLERPYDEQNKRFRTELTVPEIRKTVTFFGSTSGETGWRIAIVDPADDMNQSSANALLKALEEPPARALFLIVSHAPGRLLPTIRSRCRRLDVAPLAAAAIATALASHGDPDHEAALVSGLAEGSLRRAITLIDGDGIETYRSLTALLATLPDLNMDAAHAFADRVSGRGNDDAWAGFSDMLSAWLNRRVRGEKEPDSEAEPGATVLGTPLESWAEVWETLRRSVEQTDELNLDRKRTVLSILMSLARATRM
jgi:DNA polymerase-3 subunit delta'